VTSSLRSSAELTDEVDRLRARLVGDGYLYLPGFLATESVRGVRDQLSAVLAGYSDLTFTSESFSGFYPALQRLESFHRLAFEPRLWRLIEGLLGGEIFCHPAKVARIAAPTRRAVPATRPHQDFVRLHVATDVLTVWIPFTECDERRQGLRLIPGSHQSGFMGTDATLGGTRPLYLDVADDDPRWHTADFQVGDMVLFHSLTVHGGGPNVSGEVRLSADMRYQRTTDPMRAEFAHPHGWPQTPDWDSLCANWSSRAWIEVPDTVELVPMPADVSYGDYLADLTAPPSILMGKDF
jgi:hypothetical protein